MNRKLHRLLLVAALLVSAAGGARAQHEHHPRPAPAGEVPLYDNLGSHHYAVTTASPEAQRYFDQGLRLYYGFNHAEAIRAFDRAAKLDPSCAMCAWGTALSYGPNINAGMDSASGVAAHAAVQRAMAARAKSSPRERALIEALAKRYVPVPSVDRAALDSAYARAMGEVARRFPGDAEVATLYAESLMDLSPWSYWTSKGEPRPDTPRMLASLEGVIAAHPNHPGACHFFIHAVEAVQPERAVACAERLAGLMPGAGHLVHMPAHIYIRVGRWADAIRANQHAVHADETYIQDQRPGMGVYTSGYYPHNFHFLAFAATMAGEGEMAVEAARSVVEKMHPDVAVLAPDFAPLPAYLHLALTTFGRWEEVLAAPMPPAQLRVATGLATYARGVALAATGREAGARQALEMVKKLSGEEAEGATGPILRIAALALAGEIAQRAGRLEEAEREFRAAAAVEDEMTYFEPPLWYYPIRHSLGKVLLERGKAAEAETAYREDLERFPENGWSLRGLSLSLRAQGKTAEAAQVEARFRKAWSSGATLTASRF